MGSGRQVVLILICTSQCAYELETPSLTLPFAVEQHLVLWEYPGDGFTMCVDGPGLLMNCFLQRPPGTKSCGAVTTSFIQLPF